MLTDEQVTAIESLGPKYPGHYMAKFCVDPRRWDHEAARLAVSLGVAGLSQDVLDIGCGFGYFVNVCEGLGCTAWGLDIGDPLIAEAVGTLGVKVAFDSVETGCPLHTACSGPYDLITMFGCMLRHGHPATSHDYWGWGEYQFFFADILTRLRPGGRFIIRPNVMIDEHPAAANLLDRDKLRDCVGDGWERVVIRGPEITLMKGE